MQSSAHCSACSPMSDLGILMPLGAAPAELREIEALERQISDLVSVLRARLEPAQFQLVWALQDAVERLGLADALLREQQLVDALARHWPDHEPAARATIQHVLVDSIGADEPPSTGPRGREWLDETR